MTFGLTTLVGSASALALSTTLAFAGPGEAGHAHKSFAAGEPGDPKKPIVRTVESRAVSVRSVSSRWPMPPRAATWRRLIFQICPTMNCFGVTRS